MLDLSHIEGFDWDVGNARKSVDKHDVSQAEAEQAFFSTPLVIVEDKTHSQNEQRYNALGMSSGGRWLHVTFTQRHEARSIRIISARDMNRKERQVYDKA